MTIYVFVYLHKFSENLFSLQQDTSGQVLSLAFKPKKTLQAQSEIPYEKFHQDDFKRAYMLNYYSSCTYVNKQPCLLKLDLLANKSVLGVCTSAKTSEYSNSCE